VNEIREFGDWEVGSLGVYTVQSTNHGVDYDYPLGCCLRVFVGTAGMGNVGRQGTSSQEKALRAGIVRVGFTSPLDSRIQRLISAAETADIVEGYGMGRIGGERTWRRCFR
jgi:hypothetical protein